MELWTIGDWWTGISCKEQYLLLSYTVVTKLQYVSVWVQDLFGIFLVENSDLLIAGESICDASSSQS